MPCVSQRVGRGIAQLRGPPPKDKNPPQLMMHTWQKHCSAAVVLSLYNLLVTYP